MNGHLVQSIGSKKPFSKYIPVFVLAPSTISPTMLAWTFGQIPSFWNCFFKASYWAFDVWSGPSLTREWKWLVILLLASTITTITDMKCSLPVILNQNLYLDTITKCLGPRTIRYLTIFLHRVDHNDRTQRLFKVCKKYKHSTFKIRKTNISYFKCIFCISQRFFSLKYVFCISNTYVLCI